MLTIAHRINTILDSDRVIVLEAGSILEIDSPQRLYRKEGTFRRFVNEAGMNETLEKTNNLKDSL